MQERLKDKIKNKIKDYTYRQTLKGIIALMSRASNGSLIKMTYLAERMTGVPDTLEQIAALRKYFEIDHPSVRLGKKVLSKLSRNCRKKLIENFFIHAGISGITKHKDYARKYGYEPPWFLLLSPTMRCNLNCRRCSTREFDSRNDLPFDEMDRILTEAKQDMGIHFVATLGGEMFTRNDMFEFYKKHRDVYFQIYTNGTLIDQKIAKRLARLGNVAPMLSIEGFEEETDCRRGKGVWKKVMQAMDNLKKSGVLFGYSCTMTRNNAELITSDKFFDFMMDKGCYAGWYFQYIPIGKNPDLRLMATPEQRNELRKKLIQVRETREIFVGDFWNDGPYVQGCIAGGRNYLHINNKGGVEPCGFVHFAVDNISGKTLREVLENPFYKEMRRRIQAAGAPDAYSDNMLTPCMIIDQPWVLRDLVKKYSVFPTDGGDDLLKGEIAAGLDDYSRRMHAIYDPIWEKEYKEFHPAIRKLPGSPAQEGVEEIEETA